MTDPFPHLFLFIFWKEPQEMMLQQEGNPWGAPFSHPGWQHSWVAAWGPSGYPVAASPPGPLSKKFPPS